MNRLIRVRVVVFLTTATMANAQRLAPPADTHHPPGQAQTPAPPVQPTPTPTLLSRMMPMMDDREMMSGQSPMGPGTMGAGAQRSENDSRNDGDARRDDEGDGRHHAEARQEMQGLLRDEMTSRAALRCVQPLELA
jgi:hypothetical protein